MSNISQNTKILIIDDNIGFANVFAKFLKLKGFYVAVENSFKTGLQTLKNQKHDVLFLDVPLEDYDEKQLFQSLQTNDIFKKTYVVLFSSVDFDSIVLDQWKKSGLYYYIKKPASRTVITDALNLIRKKISSSDINSSSVTYEETISESLSEEATAEQLSKLEQLEKQIQELESQSKPVEEEATAVEPVEEEATAVEPVEEEATAVEPVEEEATAVEPVEEEATAEQLSKLEQLEKQIQKLESIEHVVSESISTESSQSSISDNYSVDVSLLSNIISDLKSFETKFHHYAKPLDDKLSSPQISESSSKNIKSENNVESLSERNNFQLTNDDIISNKKRRKTNKKTSGIKTKRRKTNKKTSGIKTKRRKTNKKTSGIKKKL